MRETDAVLFDLDDTLIDYQYSRRQGLRAVQELLTVRFPPSAVTDSTTEPGVRGYISRRCLLRSIR